MPEYAPALHDLPPKQKAMVPYESVCIPHMSHQKVTQLPNTTPIIEYMPTHRMNTSPPTPDMYAIRK
eukprot:1483455-Ditylum_brightwellii.AAC.1